MMLTENKSIAEEWLKKYPQADLRGSDHYFDDEDEFVNYMNSIVPTYCNDFGDFVTEMANEAEGLEDWITDIREDEGNDNIDYLVGIVKDTREFFPICRYEVEY